MSERIYISGKITGLDPAEVEAKFAKTEDRLKSIFGCKIVNPLKLHNGDHGKNWHGYMAADLAELLKCGTIYMQKDWRESKGARIEHAVAREMELTIIYEAPQPIFEDDLIRKMKNQLKKKLTNGNNNHYHRAYTRNRYRLVLQPMD